VWTGLTLAFFFSWWEFYPVKTLKVDAKRRIRFRDARPGQVYIYENDGYGTITLTEVKGQHKERFPRGSLLKYITPQRNNERLTLLAGCAQGPR
jgi:hypothetical protein